MSEGCGTSFAKMWYDKMANTTNPADQKTFKKFSNNFETTFYPFDTKATIHLDLSKLIQKTICLPNGTIDDSFQKYITDFQNLVSKAAITDDITLIDQFFLGIDQGITTIILSMTPVPTTINDWIEKAKTFHAQKMHIKALCSGHPQSAATFIHPQKDPNAMDIDNVNLSKLIPTKCAKCIREGHCFHCRKTGHNATICHTSRLNNTMSSNLCPQNIHHTTLLSQETPAPTHSKLDEYVNSLKTSGKSDDEIFSTLKICYEESSKEIALVALTPRILKVQDF